MALQHLRSSTAHKRPTPAAMSDGQLAINTNADSPGLFFKDSTGALTKVGPVHVGTTAPNASPASGGETGNTVGEQWLDTTGGTYVFKVWDGSAWRSETGTFVDVNGDTMTGALGIIAGDAATPGLFVSGDTNTGIYSPGADQLAISTNGAGRLFIASDGKIGVATSSPGSALQVNGAGGIRINEDGAGTKLVQLRSDYASQGPAINVFTNDPLLFLTNNTERMRLDSSGRLGLGTSSPSALLHATGKLFIDATVADDVAANILNSSATGYGIRTQGGGGTGRYIAAFNDKDSNLALIIDESRRVGIGTTSPQNDLHVNNASSDAYVRVTNNSGTRAYLGSEGTNAVIYGQTSAGAATPITFNVGSSEAARIDSAGRLLVGTSTSQGSYNLQCYGTGVWGQGAYVNGSDAALKENVEAIGPSLDLVKALRPVSFQYKQSYSQDRSVQPGFIAQDLQEAMVDQPYLDGIVQQGTQHLNVAYQGLIPVLTKALQEAIAKIETLEAKVAALEAS